MCPGCRFVSGRSLIFFHSVFSPPRVWKIGHAYFLVAVQKPQAPWTSERRGGLTFSGPCYLRLPLLEGKKWCEETEPWRLFNLKACFCQESARKIVSWTVKCWALLWDPFQPGGHSPGWGWWGRAGFMPQKRFGKGLGGVRVTRFRGWREGSSRAVGFQWCFLRAMLPCLWAVFPPSCLASPLGHWGALGNHFPGPVLPRKLLGLLLILLRQQLRAHM